jgi:hypothetical protein
MHVPSRHPEMRASRHDISSIVEGKMLFPLSHHSVYLVLPLNSSNFGRIAMPMCLVPLAFDRKLEVRNKSPLFSRGVGLRYAWYCRLGLGIDDETASRNESKRRCTRRDSSEHIDYHQHKKKTARQLCVWWIWLALDLTYWRLRVSTRGFGTILKIKINHG